MLPDLVGALSAVSDKALRQALRVRHEDGVERLACRHLRANSRKRPETPGNCRKRYDSGNLRNRLPTAALADDGVFSIAGELGGQHGCAADAAESRRLMPGCRLHTVLCGMPCCS